MSRGRDPGLMSVIPLGSIWQRKRAIEGEYLITQRMELLDIRMIRKSLCDEICDLLDVFFFHAASCYSWRADADAGWFHRAAGVEGDPVFVHGDTCFVEGVGSVGAVEVFVAEVDEHDVVVGATGADAETVMREASCDGLRVFHDLL